MDNSLIGLVIAHTGTSYGMNLQAYATQYVIEKLGYKTEILRVKPRPLDGIYVGPGLVRHLINQAKRRRQKQVHDRTRLSDEVHKKNHDERVKAAQAFRAEKLHGFSPAMGFKELCAYSKKFHAVLVGSDQCWLPGFSFGFFYSLRFVPNTVKRISYATSLGVSCYPAYCHNSAKKVWSRFDCLSVREKQGAKIINEICEGIPVSVVLDPTYLISKEEWQSLIPVKEYKKGDYVLSFMLGCDESQKQIIRQYADALGLRLVSILSNESSSSIDISYADEIVTGASPEMFVNLIRHAKLVFTDSFHGIAFSIINNVDFHCFYPKRDFAKGKLSRNARIDNVLNTFQLSDRLIKEKENHPARPFKSIDYDAVNSILSVKREESMRFLINALQ